MEYENLTIDIKVKIQNAKVQLYNTTLQRKSREIILDMRSINAFTTAKYLLAIFANFASKSVSNP